MKKIGFSKNDIKRGLRIPNKIDRRISEEIGIHLGDGSLGIYKHKSGIKYSYTISGGYDDEEYFQNFIIPLMHKLYRIYPSTYKYRDRRSLELHYQSKGLIFFKRSLGLPLGKKENLKIPDIVKNSKCKLDLIRGLFDTDGSLFFRKRNKKVNYYPCISISNKNRIFIQEITKLLNKKGFDVTMSTEKSKCSNGTLCVNTKLNINGKNSLLKWMKLIGTSHPKNLTKFSLWRKYGYIPKGIKPWERIELSTSALPMRCSTD